MVDLQHLPEEVLKPVPYQESRAVCGLDDKVLEAVRETVRRKKRRSCLRLPVEHPREPADSDAHSDLPGCRSSLHLSPARRTPT